jgi:LPS-assembly lipoprotein
LFQFLTDRADDDGMYLESGYKSESAAFATTHPSPFVRRARLRSFVANCALPSGLKVIFEQTAEADGLAMEPLTANATKTARFARRQGGLASPDLAGKTMRLYAFQFAARGGAGRGSGTSLLGPKRRAVEPRPDTCDRFARAICFNWVREGACMQAFELGFVRGLMAVVGMALCLSACEIRPLYGPTTMGIPLADELKAIEITPIPDRIGHYVRNELIFAFNGTGSETTPARYRLDVKLKERVQSPIIDTVTGRATSATVFMDAEYKLTALATRKEVTSGTLMQIASYDRFSNRLSNVRAARDSEIRDAKTIADEIRSKISMTLAFRDPSKDKEPTTSPAAPKDAGAAQGNPSGQ